jgi:hypothetical protein
MISVELEKCSAAAIQKLSRPLGGGGLWIPLRFIDED